jgi:hypothetical protein
VGRWPAVAILLELDDALTPQDWGPYGSEFRRVAIPIELDEALAPQNGRGEECKLGSFAILLELDDTLAPSMYKTHHFLLMALSQSFLSWMMH